MHDARWSVKLSTEAQADMDALRDEHGDNAYRAALNDLLTLEEDPIPPDAVKMRGTKDEYRIYIYRSRYRAIYQVLVGRQLVRVTRVQARPVVYSGYERW